MFKKTVILFALIILAVLILPEDSLAQSATLYFTPTTGTFSQGESFWVVIMVNTGSQAVNAVAAYFSYPEDQLEPLGINTAGSVMTIFAEKNTGAGKIEISGGTPNPGFTGIYKIASVGFRVKTSSGTAKLQLSEDSAVLTNAENKNILSLTSSGQGNYAFKARSTALQQPSEPLKPVISEVKVNSVTRDMAVIAWKTDQPADSIVEYGLAEGYEFTVSDDKLTKDHALTISELLPLTLYHFKAKSQTATGQISVSQALTFSTRGYLTEIQVLQHPERTPLAEAEVVFLGPPETTKMTDKDGKVVLDLAEGKQWISVKYGENSIRQRLDISAQEDIQRFEILFGGTTSGVDIFFIVLVIASAALSIFLILKLFRIWRFKVDN